MNGAHNICTVAREKNVKTIVFTSTVAVYGFAPLGTNELGEISPFNDCGVSKYEAENVFREWQKESPKERALFIVRPTVVFGETNRGNVYNLLKQISARRFVMIGDGSNRKSMAYVENVVAFLKWGLTCKAGVHVYNYADKPDFTMRNLVAEVNGILNRRDKLTLRLPFWMGYAIAKVFDACSRITGRSFAISSIRVKKFCSDSVYNTAVDDTSFVAPVELKEALRKTVIFEFMKIRD